MNKEDNQAPHITCLCFHFEAFEVKIVEGNGDAGITFNSLSNNLCCWFNLLTSYKEMLALIFFISSTILYSMLYEIIKVLDDEGDLEVVGA